MIPRRLDILLIADFEDGLSPTYLNKVGNAN